ncbi:Rossmann-fold NAD(P)-binding domain-containing protein [Defluviicoccus vanus]|uniref:N-acetyltransferase domain-containing protein n=1 Tax=Defluviicoccus vanus TaxID=111831 RepID=A0A7H1N344_9PROT|nr:hypothetical protein [Defluviicoccus vanus]QNT70130.1 hypothetical protein HQ394_13330 [Defluviicoccus vanus]
MSDEYWLPRASIPDPGALVAELKRIGGFADVFTFTQKVPDTEPVHPYRSLRDNVAVLPISSYEAWFREQIPATTRRHIRASEKKGVTVAIADYDDAYVAGIMSIYNETPFRAGRRYWHYGKDFDAVKRENGTYCSRSTYLSASIGGEFAGYLKIVWDDRTAAIMQILSKISARNNRTNNALIAAAVRQCCERKVEYLLYEKYDYGNKADDSLTQFKKSNGFVRMDLPRYYVPLTTMGELALRLDLHRPLAEKLPEWALAPARRLRAKWCERCAERESEFRGASQAHP